MMAAMDGARPLTGVAISGRREGGDVTYVTPSHRLPATTAFSPRAYAQECFFSVHSVHSVPLTLIDTDFPHEPMLIDGTLNETFSVPCCPVCRPTLTTGR